NRPWPYGNAGNTHQGATKELNLRAWRIVHARALFQSYQACARTTRRRVLHSQDPLRTFAPPWRSLKFQKLRRASSSSRRQRMIQDAQLREHGGLIPIEMLAGHFAGLKLNDAHEGELDFSTRGWHTRKHPIHPEC